MFDKSVISLVLWSNCVFPFAPLGLVRSIVDEESDIARRKDDGSVAER